MAPVLMATWPYLLIATWIGLAAWASGHAILTKRNVQAALSWTGVVWLLPVVGPVLYSVAGINRVRRRADRLRRAGGRLRESAMSDGEACRAPPGALPDGTQHLADLAELVGRVTRLPLLSGNRVELLDGGDRAYPEMLRSIAEARRFVRLLSYIFEDSPIGREFVAALGRARRRGVDVRLLVDDAGSPGGELDRLCRLEGVPIARFLPVRLSRRIDQLNLRNHRKILVVDGRVGFTGGLNVQQGHVLESQPRWPVRDTHFRFEGPVVAHFAEVFADDWHFTTGQGEPEAVSEGEPPGHAQPSALGAVYARGLAEGPDETFDRLRLTFLGALACAERYVAIVTPYFLPDEALATALRVAALRGIRIDVVVPERTDVRVVDYAAMAQVGQVLAENVRVWQSPLPFDHSKLMVVDDHWCCVGSANWDPRSLRLNFEFNVECYDRDLARSVRRVVDRRIAESREITASWLRRQSLPVRLRNGMCRLLMPYI